METKVENKRVILKNITNDKYYSFLESEDKLSKEAFKKNEDLMVEGMLMNDVNNVLSLSDVKEKVYFKDLKAELIRYN